MWEISTIYFIKKVHNNKLSVSQYTFFALVRIVTFKDHKYLKSDHEAVWTQKIATSIALPFSIYNLYSKRGKVL